MNRFVQWLTIPLNYSNSSFFIDLFFYIVAGTVSSFQKPYSNGSSLPMVYSDDSTNPNNSTVSSLHMLPLGVRQNKSQHHVIQTTSGGQRTSRSIDMEEQIGLLSISGSLT